MATYPDPSQLGDIGGDGCRTCNKLVALQGPFARTTAVLVPVAAATLSLPPPNSSIQPSYLCAPCNGWYQVVQCPTTWAGIRRDPRWQILRLAVIKPRPMRRKCAGVHRK